VPETFIDKVQNRRASFRLSSRIGPEYPATVPVTAQTSRFSPFANAPTRHNQRYKSINISNG